MFVWNIDPVIFSIGPVDLRWYSLLFAGSFILGLSIMDRIFKREHVDTALLDPLLIHVAIGTVLFARLGHCLLYEPGYFLAHPIEILKIWNGGLASHGGGLGMILALFIFSRKHKDLSMLFLSDRIAIPALLGATLVRIGNFFNSEILGIPTGRSWGVIFMRVDSTPRHPVQLYEAGCYLAFFIILWILYSRTAIAKHAGALSGLFLTTVFTLRFFIDFFKVNQEAYALWIPLDTGQLLSVPAVLLGLFLIRRSRIL